MKYSIIICLLFSSCFQSNDFGDKKGYYEVRGKNGIPKYIKFFDDHGNLNGVSISFTAEGNVHSYIYIKDSTEIGPSMIYYPNGRLNTADVFINGKQEGISVHYHPDGYLTRKFYYRNGVKHGEQYFFDYDTGDTLKVEIYDKGLLIETIHRK